jgi:hypothetical protein
MAPLAAAATAGSTADPTVAAAAFANCAKPLGTEAVLALRALPVLLLPTSGLG